MEELSKRIEYKWKAGGKKPMLVSTPGKGKTAFVNYMGEKLGVKVKAINTSTFEGVDANGMPYINPETKELNISKPFWLEGLKDGDILFLDEFSNAPSEVRNAFLQIILDQKLPSGAEMPQLRIIGAMNPADDLEGYVEFSNAMKDRWAFIPFDFPAEEWHKLYKDNFGKPQTPKEKKIREKLSQFLTTNPHLLEGRKPLKASAYGITDTAEATTIEYATPNRRNWDNLARELAQTENDEEEKKMRKDMFMENVGLECWRNFKEYIATENKPLDKYKWDGEPDEITQQVNRLKAENDVDKQAEYFVRAHEYCKNKEVIASILPDVLKNAISKYGIEYRNKLPDLYKVYQEIGA